MSSTSPPSTSTRNSRDILASSLHRSRSLDATLSPPPTWTTSRAQALVIESSASSDKNTPADLPSMNGETASNEASTSLKPWSGDENEYEGDGDDHDDDDDDSFFIKKKALPPSGGHLGRISSAQRPGRSVTRDQSQGPRCAGFFASGANGEHSQRGGYSPQLAEEEEQDDQGGGGCGDDDFDIDDESEGDPPSSYDVNGRKRKRKKHARLPSWTRGSQKPEQSPSSGQLMYTCAIDVDDEALEGASGRDAVSKLGQKAKKARSVSLTPPPPMDPEYRRKISEIVDNTLASHRAHFGRPSSAAERGEIERSSSTSPIPPNRVHRARPLGAGIWSASRNANGSGGAEGDVFNSSIDASTTNESQSIVHPDLAPFLRGSEAAEMRRLAKLEEERMRRAEALKRAMDEQQKLEEQQQREERRRQTLLEAQASERRRESQSKDAGGIICLSSSDSEDTRMPLESQVGPLANGGRRHAEAVGDVIALSDDDGDDCGSRHAQSRPAIGSCLAGPSHGAEPAAGATGAESAGPHISVMLRSKAGKEMRLRVKPTTTFRKMLNHFISCTIDSSDASSLRAAPAPAAVAISTRQTRNSTAAIRSAQPTSAVHVGAMAKMMWDGQLLSLDASVESIEDLEDDEIIDVLW